MDKKIKKRGIFLKCRKFFIEKISEHAQKPMFLTTGKEFVNAKNNFYKKDILLGFLLVHGAIR